MKYRVTFYYGDYETHEVVVVASDLDDAEQTALKEVSDKEYQYSVISKI